MTARARWAIRSLAVIACLAVFAGVGVWWLVNTEAGAKWGFERLGSFFPGRLDVRDITGPLKGPLKVRYFAYKNPHLSISADSVVIQWHLRQLLSRRLEIDRIRANDVTIIVGAPGNTPEAQDSLAQLPDLNMPVAVVIHDGLLQRVSITTPRSDSALVIDRIAVDARSTRHDSLYVNHLLARSKSLDLDFSGVAFPHHGYPVRLRGDWVYRAPNVPEIRGEGALVGTLDTLRVLQDLSGAFDAHVDLHLFRPLRKLGYQGDVEFSRLSPRRLAPAWPAGTFHGRVGFTGDLDTFSGEGAIAGATDAVGVAAADFRVRRAKDTWYLDQFLATRPGSKTRFQARGTVVADSINPRFDLQTEWADLGWPLQGKPLAQSKRGSARVKGTLRDFGIRLEALLSGDHLPPGRWTLDGRGGDGRLAIHTIIADIMGGRIVGSGAIGWQPRTEWNLKFDGKGINPAAAPQLRGYPGSLAFTGRSQGTAGAAGATGRILVSRLSGTLRDQPVSGVGTLTAREGQFNLSGASLQWGPNRAVAGGGFGKRWSLTWNVDAPRIGASLAQASGSLRSQGSIQGPKDRPRIAGTLAADSLFVGRLHSGTLRADGDVSLAPGGPVRLDASAIQVDAGRYSAQRVTIVASGTRDQHQVRASVAGRLDSTVTVLAGGFVRGGWRGMIRQFDLVHHRTGNWSLGAPAHLAAQDKHVTVKDLQWQSGTSRITLNGDWERQGPWHMDAHLDQVQLSLFQTVLAPRLALLGTVRGGLTARGTSDGRLFADLDLIPGPGKVLYQTAAGQWVPTDFTNAEVRATADGNRGQGSLRADLVNVGTVRGSLAWPASFSPGAQGRPISGNLAVHLRDIGILQGFTSEVDRTTGSLDADLTIGGTARYPSVYGPASLQNGAADVPRLGLQLREMTFTARGNPGGELAIQGTLRSGPGTVNLSGTAAMSSGAVPVANLTISGKRVQAMNTRDAQLLASPDLHAVMKGNRVDVTGSIDFPQGKIDLGQQDSRRLVKVSPDVVYEGADTLSNQAIEFHSRVRVSLGDNVKLSGYGLDVHPTGSLLAMDSPGLPTLATGRLEIKDGTYQIYGQTLAVESGSLTFGGGPINNPAVQARATRKAADGTVAGFLVSGTVMRPEVNVFSEPPMGQNEAMSYVLFGKPVEKANLSEAQMANTMGTALGVPGTNMIAHGIASTLGIEKAQVQVGNSFQNTSVALGTHLSPKFYLGYGVDVFQSTSSLEFKYILNRIFTIEAEAAHENRVDILYSVER